MNKSMKNENAGSFDVAVIGAGSAGFSAAIAAAELGKRVALIGSGTIGGTCVNVGCVPSKALIRAVEPLHVARAAHRFDGIQSRAEVADWKAVVAQKQQLVESLRQAKYIDVLPAHDGVAYIEGKCRFVSAHRLMVGDREIDADRIIIATGARAFVPDIVGLKEVPYLTSTEALELEELPRSLAVIGAGFIGVEIAQIYLRAGVEVTLVSRRGVLPDAEPEIREALSGYLKDEGMNLVQVDSYESVARTEEGIELVFAGHGATQRITAEKLMVATGRVANSSGMNLDVAGVALDDRGNVKVDETMRTSQAHIYAAGDVTGRDQFVYMAAYGARIAVRNAVAGEGRVYDNSSMPEVVFSDPQVARVGLGEAQALAAGYEVRTSVLGLDNVPRALAARDTRGLIKLVADRKSGRLLGAHILAPEGADSIQTAALAIRSGMTYMELGEVIFPYLTNVEGLKLAAQTFDMDVEKLSCCAG